ncbi:glucose-1-phosphate adenylyltransferase [Niveibacterium sp. SC-1]|uniref:glucose-1-phosphate adenylyltransferase n=1 Tax=Niveibacterium sp. SC-1 TaxID=3135646 RepID=UPI00311EA26F
MSTSSIARPGPTVGQRFVSQLTRRTYAMVLAGGRGSRLHELTDWRAKPAVPFGGKFRIIDFALSNCVNSGIRRIGVATQYKAQSLIRHLQRGWSFLDGRFDEFIDVMPAQQQICESKWYQGTADAVFQNLDRIRQADPDYVLVLAGDHIYKMDYGRMLAEHVARGAELSVACIDVPIAEASAFGVMAVDEDGRVLAFQEKPATPAPMPGSPDRALASMGVYVFNRKFLFEQLVLDEADPNSSHDFGKDIIPRCLREYPVYAHDFATSSVGEDDKTPYWRDVGTIDAYWEANLDLTHVIPDLNLYAEEWPIWTAQEQLPPAKFVFDDDDRRGTAVDSLVAGGCIISGAHLRRSLAFARVHIHSYCEVEDAVILPSVEIGRGCKLRRVVIDKYCKIPPNTRIGFDPEEDRRLFHVTSRGITLVTPAMLGQEVHFLR